MVPFRCGGPEAVWMYRMCTVSAFYPVSGAT
jgi:hypothetical protein